MPAEQSLPPGRRRFTASGLAIRAIKALPAALRERALDGLTGGVSANLPPFQDILRMVEAAGGIPNGTRWKQRLLTERPELRAVRTRDVTDDREGRVRVRLYLPPVGAPLATAAFVWVHGGAFILGSLDAKEAHWPAMEMAATGIPVISVDYRMCLHGINYPQPLEDVLSAWHWAIDHAEETGVAPAHFHLGGGSAGACLAAAATIRLRDQGVPMPASLYLAYPVLEGHLSAATPEVAAHLEALNIPPDEWLTAMFSNWAGGAPWNDPTVSPGAADPTGLPPTYILTCGGDALRRSSEPFAQRLSEAGVPVWHDIFPAAEHAPLDRPGTPDGSHAIARLHTWLTSGVAGMSA